MVDVRFELTTNDPWSADDAICEGISPLGYLQKVNPSPTQTKPCNTLPPFEQRDSWSSYGAVRAFIILGAQGDMFIVRRTRKPFFEKKCSKWDSNSCPAVDANCKGRH